MGFDMKAWLADKKITEVECLVSDISGIARGKILPVTKFISAQQSGGLRLPEYVFGQSVTGEYYDSDVLDEIGRDVILRPDISTCRLVPWYDEPTAQIIHDAVQLKILGRVYPRDAHCAQAVGVVFGNNAAYDHRNMSEVLGAHFFHQAFNQRDVAAR